MREEAARALEIFTGTKYSIRRPKNCRVIDLTAIRLAGPEDAEDGHDQTHDFGRGCCGSGSRRGTALVRPANGNAGQVLRKGPGSHLLRGSRFRVSSIAASRRWSERDHWVLHRQPAV